MPESIRETSTRTRDGVSIHIGEWGDPAGREILFIHGLGASSKVWGAQARSPLLRNFRMIAYDLRGHGKSDKPAEGSYYADAARWADELRTVMRAKSFKRPVIVAWSYGGRVLVDYVERFGVEGLAGVHFVSAMPVNDPAFIGPALLAGATAPQPDPSSARQAQLALLPQLTFRPLPADRLDALAEAGRAVPAALRQSLRQRPRTAEAVLRSFACPVWMTHGLNDRAIVADASVHACRHFPNARASFYENCGHMPFLEHEDRFNRELAAFVDRVNADGAPA